MRIKIASNMEFIELIDLKYPVSGNTRLKPVRPVIIQKIKGNNHDTLRSDDSDAFAHRSNTVSNNLCEIIYRMIG